MRVSIKNTMFALATGISLLTIGSAALASMVSADFASLTTTTAIDDPYNPLCLGGVSVYFDAQGNPDQFASADQVGLYGTTNGALVLTFASPITTLNVDWTVENAAGEDPYAFFFLPALSTGELTGDPVVQSGTYDATLRQIKGSLNYEGASFTLGTIYFSIGTGPAVDPNLLFTVNSISYGDGGPSPASTAVPLPPAAWSGLVLLGGLGLKRLRRHLSA